MSEKLLLSSWWEYTYCKLTTSTPTTPKTCFEWVWISTTIGVWHIFGINYQLQVPKWILIKVGKWQSNTFKLKYKYTTTTLITIYAQLLKETLHCIIPLFHQFPVWDWNDVVLLLRTVWLCHVMCEINMSLHNVCIIYYKSWQQYINSKVMKLLLYEKGLYNMQLTPIKICCCNDIDFIQKVAFIQKIKTNYHT